MKESVLLKRTFFFLVVYTKKTGELNKLHGEELHSLY